MNPGEVEQAMATLYDTLGVQTHATDEEIKRAYRKAAMKWHPDRNHGAQEEVARAAFQEIKDAYAILSDPEQRKVYDSVYAEQMRGWEAQRARQHQAKAKREAAARAADEAAYAEMVSVAIRFADEGHNRDVLFGVLLGRQCEARRAAQIAAAMNADATAGTHADTDTGAARGPDTSTPTEGAAVKEAAADHPARGKQAQHARRDESATDAHPAGALSGLWFQFLNGLRF
jgi:curved DNA-binding protein CbpA